MSVIAARVALVLVIAAAALWLWHSGQQGSTQRTWRKHCVL